MRILLRRWTTQFLLLEGGLEEDEPEPGVEEVEELEGERERQTQERERCLLSGTPTCFFTQADMDRASRQPAADAKELQSCKSKHGLSVVADTCSGRSHLKLELRYLYHLPLK